MMLAVATTIATPMTPVVVHGSRGWQDDRRALRLAFAVPQRPRQANQRRYCFNDALTRPDTIRRVCRTRRDWNELGMDPVLPAEAQLANH